MHSYMRQNPQAVASMLSHAAELLQKDEPDTLKFERLWHTLMALRASLMAVLLKNTVGPRVLTGPFQSMQLTPEIMVLAFGPILTGCYEQELHPVIERVVTQAYASILNIGCGFGYYSVGLARRMPGVTVHAFDTDEAERQKCQGLAALNGVGDRVHVGGAFRGEDFAAYADKKTLLIVDIEGGEVALLDPALYPALRKMDMIVELHNLYDASISQKITQRFASTHDIEIIPNQMEMFDFRPVIGTEAYMDPLDRLLINWENRPGPTPWAVMKAR